MVARSLSLMAVLAFTANAVPYSYSNSTTVTQDVTVYTTVCPATSTMISGTKSFTSTYNTTSTITFCKRGCPTATSKPNCEQVRSDCQTKPNANQAVCAALYAQCAGTTDGLNHPAPSQTAATSKPNCEQVRSDCQTKPNANQAVCAALYAQCAGTTDGLNQPAPSQTTQDITIYTTICPATSIISGKTSVYITTSTITFCRGVCPASATQAIGSSVETHALQNTPAAVAAQSKPVEIGSSVETHAVQSTPVAIPAPSKSVENTQFASQPGATHPVATHPAAVPSSKPAENAPAQSAHSTLAAPAATTPVPAVSSKPAESAPSARPSAVEFTGAASAMKIEYASLAGLGLFFLL